MKFALLSLLAILLSGLLFAGESMATERSFEECRNLAMTHGVPPRRATFGKIETKYLCYKAAGTALHPKGQMARCMSGRS
jgi:hypothetical protein